MERVCNFLAGSTPYPNLLRTYVPGIAETLDWGRSLAALHQNHLDPDVVSETLGVVFKDRNDVRQVKESLSDFLGRLGVQAKEIPETAEVS